MFLRGSEHTLKEANILWEKRKRVNHERGLLVGLSEGRANFLWLSATAVNSEVGPNQATAFREIQKESQRNPKKSQRNPKRLTVKKRKNWQNKIKQVNREVVWPNQANAYRELSE